MVPSKRWSVREVLVGQTSGFPILEIEKFILLMAEIRLTS